MEPVRGRAVRQVSIAHLLVSPAHAYEGRPVDGPRTVETRDVDAVDVVAGKGLVGDRYFGRRAHVSSCVTLIAESGLADAAVALGLPAPLDPALARRNLVLVGVAAQEVAALAGVEFVLGGVRFRGGRPATPCGWMDAVYAPGARRAMRGRGGLRCAPLTSGTLRRGPADLEVAADSMTV